MIEKQSKICFKIYPKIDQKSSKNGFKIDQKSIQKRSKIGSGTGFAFEAVFGLISVAFWLQLGAVLGGKMGPCWVHVGQNNQFLEVPEGIQK